MNIKFYNSYDVQVRNLTNRKSEGAADLSVPVRKDINIVEQLDLPAEYNAVLESVNLIGRPEFYGKAEFGIYVDRAIQRILTEPYADPRIGLEAAQNLATVEALAQFNANLNE